MSQTKEVQAEAAFEFFKNTPTWGHQINRILGESQGGGGDFGEIFRVISKLKDGDKESWYSEWAAMARYAEELGSKAESNGLIDTARESYFRASNYYRMADFYLDQEDPREIATYGKYASSFSRAATLLEPKLEMIDIPFEGKKLHAYYARGKGASGKTPCVIVFGGSDSSIEELYFSVVKDAVERGITVLAFDGPGQGYTLRFEQLYARHDFEKPVGAVIDYLEKHKQDQVDMKRIAVFGRSFGGYYGPRAASQDHRVAAVVCLDGIYDVLSNVIDHGTHKRPGGNRMINMDLGVKTDQEARPKLAKFTLEGIAQDIQCPIVILHGKFDNLCAVEGARKLYDSIKHDSKTLRIFDCGHSMHAYKSEAQAFVFDWLKQTLKF